MDRINNYLNNKIQFIEDRYYKLECRNCDNDWYGTRTQYTSEMSNPDSEWTCGHCRNRESSAFDDNYFELQQDALEEYEYLKSLEERIQELEFK